jgi:hypothetical protein
VSNIVTIRPRASLVGLPGRVVFGVGSRVVLTERQRHVERTGGAVVGLLGVGVGLLGVGRARGGGRALRLVEPGRRLVGVLVVGRLGLVAGLVLGAGTGCCAATPRARASRCALSTISTSGLIR